MLTSQLGAGVGFWRQVTNVTPSSLSPSSLSPDAEIQRREWATQIVAGPRFAFGGCSLTSGDSEDDVEFTRCTSVGAFVMKGLYEVGFGSFFAFGAEATYERSGDARFDREPVDLTRDASLYRIMAHGDVRFSRGKSVPYLRLGVGIQYTKYGDDDTDFAGFYSAGGGLEYRLGDQFSVAVGAGYISSSSLGGEASTGAVDVNLRLGYRWGSSRAKGLIAPSS